MENFKRIATDTYTQHKLKFAKRMNDWKMLMDRYLNKERAGSITSETDSNVQLGAAFSLVENAIPRLLSRQPRYKYLGRGKEDSEAADLYNDFSDWQWDEANCQAKLRELVKIGLIKGMVGWRMGWEEQKVIKKKRTKTILGYEVTNPLLKAMGKPAVMDEEESKSNYTFDVITPEDMIWNGDAKDPDKVRVVGYKFKKTYLEAKSDGYDVTKLRPSFYEINKDEPNVENPRLIEDSIVEMAEVWVRLINKQGYYESKVITLGAWGDSNPVVVKTEDNPLDKKFAPFGFYRPILVPGKIYGFGVIEPTMGVIDAEEDTLNITIDALWTDVSRPVEYNPSNLIAPKELRYKPRTLIPVRALGQSTAVWNTPTPNTNGVNFMTEYLTKTKQNISGITDYQTGSEQVGGAKTLGEITIKTQESNARLQMMLDALEKEVLEPMGKFALWFNQQYLSENDKIFYRVLGKKGEFKEQPIKFKDIEAITDVKIVSGSSAMVMQQSEIQKWSLLLNQANQEAQMGPMGVPINREEIWIRLLENGILEKNVELFLPSVKEREESQVGDKMKDKQHALEENANPMAARVFPSDTTEVHVPLHQAEIKARNAELQATQDPMKAEELQMLVQHLNDHAQMAGGMVPPYSANMEVGQGNNSPRQNANMGTASPPSAGGRIPSQRPNG